MKRYASVLILLLLAPVLSAQEKARKVVEVKYVNPGALSGIVSSLGVDSHSDNQLKAIVLSGFPDAVAKAEEAIRKLDVPPPQDKNIELLAYLVLGSNDAATGSEPADLAPAIRQMRSVFSYKSYRLLDTLWVRSAGGERFASNGLAPAALKVDPNFDPTYVLQAGRVHILSTEPKAVRIENLSLTLALRQGSGVGFNTSFDARDGQKIVLGKLNPNGADTGIILVVGVKVVD